MGESEGATLVLSFKLNHPLIWLSSCEGKPRQKPPPPPPARVGRGQALASFVVSFVASFVEKVWEEAKEGGGRRCLSPLPRAKAAADAGGDDDGDGVSEQVRRVYPSAASKCSASHLTVHISLIHPASPFAKFAQFAVTLPPTQACAFSAKIGHRVIFVAYSQKR